MSKFHESVRDIMHDVSSFLVHTLQDERLSAATIAHKETILMKLTHLNREYQQLNLSIPDRLSSPPYIDMGGCEPSTTDYVLGESPEDVYEECNLETSLEVQKFIPKTINDNKTLRKSGYLEKKGKEGFGRLLSQRKWYTIQGNALRFFNRPDGKEIGCIELPGYEARPITGHKEGSFELVCPGRKSYNYVAPSLQDMDEWIEAVNQIYDDTHVVTAGTVEDDEEEEPIYDDGNASCNDILDVEDPQDWYLALWDCLLVNSRGELGFKRGDIMRIVSKAYDGQGWWICQRGEDLGLVPKDFLTEAYEIVLCADGPSLDTDA